MKVYATLSIVETASYIRGTSNSSREVNYQFKDYAAIILSSVVTENVRSMM